MEDNIEDNIEDEAAFEFTTRQELIACSYYAIASVSDLDTGMMTKADANRIKRIIRRSVKLIDTCINELYDTEFEDDDDED
jgi:hypothetical protein